MAAAKIGLATITEAKTRQESLAVGEFYGNRPLLRPITCALAPYITLTEAGAKFEVRPLNFRRGQHTSPEYLKINPKHKVPLLIVDGRVLSESVAIQNERREALRGEK